MIKLLVSLLPLAIAAAIMPTTWGMILLLLNRTPNPLKSSFALLAGPICYLFLLSLLALWIVGPIQDSLFQKNPGDLEKNALILMAKFGLSLTFLCMGLATLLARPHPHREHTWHHSLQRLAEINPWKLFLLSFLTQIPRWKTLALLLSALTLIAASESGPLERLIALLLYLALAYSAYVFPFLSLLLAPQKTPERLERLIDVLEKKSITVALYLFLAYLFFQSGIQTLF